MPEIKQHKSITKTIRTTVTLEQKQYDPILRKAVGAPDNANVSIEDNYGGDIIITWEETTTEGDD